MAEQKRILIFCGGTRVFGAEIVTLSIMKALKETGYELFCISSGWNDGSFHQRLEEAEINYQPVKLGFIYLSKLLWTIDTLVHLPGSISTIKKIVREFKPDLIYHTSYTTLLMGSFLLRKSRNLLFVFDPYYGRLNRIYFKSLNKIVDTYVAVSESIKINLIEIGASSHKIIVLKNGIDVETFSDPKDLNNIIHFGIIGQIMPRKGHNDVIEALKILRDRDISFKCLIIGTGNNEFVHSLQEKIKQYNLDSYVEWVDFIKERNEIYKLIDVVLVPSVALDPLPTVAMEAGLYYKPCIVTSAGGLPEIIINNTTGFIVNISSPAELADKMQELIAHTGLIKTMGLAAHNHIVKNFNLRIQVQKLYPIIND